MKNKRFSEVYIKFRKLVMKIVYDYLNDSFLAEEICQQVFVAFYEHMDNIYDEKGVKPWLIVASRNAVFDYLRKQKVRKDKKVYLCADAAEKARAAEEEAVVHVADEKPFIQILEDLQVKNKEWYKVVKAICVDGMKQREAAEYLRISPQVLNARLYRAKQYIRNKYEKEYDGQ